MAKRRKVQRHTPSGAPNISNRRSLNTPDASQTTFSQNMPYGNYLDGNAALGKVPHPSDAYATQELTPVKPREAFK